ncbi:elongation factor P 5-aminopentanone reductase [Exiguobacterium flavidum]|uniref:elongation factor P 5-aminopentanone reductase n=1 Tax=Exiguobacterium flavidum TaxID=2184695 RepID=UPI000DF7B45F|nr:SDR family oxidoreductase [Exiguobacterium flavidum]
MRILVTGASGAIGRALIDVLMPRAESFVLHTHSKEDELVAYAETIPVPVEIIQADLSDRDSLASFCEKLPVVDAFVHNAGTSYSGLLIDQDESSISSMLTLHVEALIRISRTLTARKPFDASLSIVTIASIWGLSGAAGEVTYSACKAGQIGFVKAYAKELGPLGGRINAVAPGWIDTPMNEDYTEEDRRSALEEIPAGRMGTVKEVADAVEFLLGPRASYVSGTILKIDGGWI